MAVRKVTQRLLAAGCPMGSATFWRSLKPRKAECVLSHPAICLAFGPLGNLLKLIGQACFQEPLVSYRFWMWLTPHLSLACCPNPQDPFTCQADGHCWLLSEKFFFGFAWHKWQRFAVAKTKLITFGTLRVRITFDFLQALAAVAGFRSVLFFLSGKLLHLMSWCASWGWSTWIVRVAIRDPGGMATSGHDKNH